MARTQQNLDCLRARLSVVMGDQKQWLTGITLSQMLEDIGLEDCPTATSKGDRLRGAVEASSDEQIVEASQKS